MPDYNSVYARVQRGALLLDLRLPEWAAYVRRAWIDTGDPQFCVLGQLAREDPRVSAYLEERMHPELARASFGSYLCTVLFLYGDWPAPSWFVEHGFSGHVWVPSKPGPVNLLDGAWFDEVIQRGGGRSGRPRGMVDVPRIA